jgi:hypothetical protein
MQPPNIRSMIRDPKRNVTYCVLACRTLTREELLQSVAACHAQPRVRRRKTRIQNATITIYTIYGSQPGM